MAWEECTLIYSVPLKISLTDDAVKVKIWNVLRRHANLFLSTNCHNVKYALRCLVSRRNGLVRCFAEDSSRQEVADAAPGD